MSKEQTINKLNEVYERIQTLNIQPTQTNMEKMLQCLYDLREAARMINGEAEKNEPDTRTPADPGGRDGD